MSTRSSGFSRAAADYYPTPAWVIDALAEHVNLTALSVWEPACGEGQMVRALESAGATATGTDLTDHGFAGMADTFDFTGTEPYLPAFYFDSIISNPPYGVQGRVAETFIEKGLSWLPAGGLMAMLLPVDFDSAKTRGRLFADCPHFAAKIVLRRRICWFEPKPGQAGPSANHAWFIWVRSHMRSPWCPVTLYAPSHAVEKINSQQEAA